MFYNVIYYLHIHGFQKDSFLRGECSKTASWEKWAIKGLLSTVLESSRIRDQLVSLLQGVLRVPSCSALYSPSPFRFYNLLPTVIEHPICKPCVVLKVLCNKHIYSSYCTQFYTQVWECSPPTLLPTPLGDGQLLEKVYGFLFLLPQRTQWRLMGQLIKKTEL